jgi:Ni,Fe-hydrogenase III small subunit/ferredoxin
MILDLLKSGLNSPRRLLPVSALQGSCQGSRMPAVQAERLTPALAQRAVEVCPTGALALETLHDRPHLRLDYGRCTGCGECLHAAPDAFVVAGQFPYCGVSREGLLCRWDLTTGAATPGTTPADVHEEILSLMGRALNIRQLDPGSCNGCEAEIVALTNPYYDLERFGIHFVASPKHADMLLATGPVTRNMAEAVRQTYEAMPEPKLVVAVGACGISAGLFAASDAIVGPVDSVIPVDGYIPGCPPTPAMLVSGILEVLRQRVGSPREQR